MFIRFCFGSWGWGRSLVVSRWSLVCAGWSVPPFAKSAKSGAPQFRLFVQVRPAPPVEAATTNRTRCSRTSMVFQGISIYTPARA